MQKNISITIGGIVFHIEEPAYARLNEYLAAVKDRFTSQAEGEEIVADIENRIAERFLSSLENGERVIKQKDVEDLIRAMGNPEDFEAADEDIHSAPVGRKLYRNPDDALIAGVASGLAAYFGLEPVVVRLLFLITLFFGGAGILLYIFLFVIVPEAKTPTEKLRMRGKAVTLASVDQVIRDSVTTLKERAPKREALRSLGEAFRRIVKMLFRLIGIAFGLFFSILSAVGIVAASVFLVLGLTRGYSPYLELPIAEAAGSPLFMLALIAGFLVVSIPLFFIFRFGAELLRRRSWLKARLAWPLLSVWFIAVITFVASGFHIGARYQDFMANNPTYRITTRSFVLEDFSKIEAKDGLAVNFKEGKEFSVVAEGRRINLDHLDLKVEDKALLARASMPAGLCLFSACSRTTLTITAPSLEAIQLENGARFRADTLHGQGFKASLLNGSSADLAFASGTGNVELSLENASRANLGGYSKHLELSLKNGSYVDAARHVTEAASVFASNSSDADLDASRIISGTLENGSRVSYAGSPEIKVILKNGSNISPEEIAGEETQLAP